MRSVARIASLAHCRASGGQPKAAMPSAPRGSGKDRERWAWQDGSGEKEEAESFGEMKDPVSFHSSVTFHGAMVAFWVIEPPTQKNHGCPNFHAIREAQHQDHAAIPGFFP